MKKIVILLLLVISNGLLKAKPRYGCRSTGATFEAVQEAVTDCGIDDLVVVSSVDDHSAREHSDVKPVTLEEDAEFDSDDSILDELLHDKEVAYLRLGLLNTIPGTQRVEESPSLQIGLLGKIPVITR